MQAVQGMQPSADFHGHTVSYLLIHGHLVHLSVERLAEVACVFQEQGSLAHMLHCSLHPLLEMSDRPVWLWPMRTSTS